MAEEIIKARVWQKIATEAEWNVNPLVLGPGEQAFVFTPSGAPVNFKIGDGTKTFAQLPWYFDAVAKAGFFGSASPTDIPTPASGDGFWIVSEAGTYTNFGGVELPADSYGFITRIGTDYAIIVSSVDLSGYTPTGGSSKSTQDLDEEKASKTEVEPTIATVEMLFQAQGSLIDKEDSVNGLSTVPVGDGLYAVGFPIGTRGSFIALKMPLQAPFSPPTQLEARVKLTDSDGSVLQIKRITGFDSENIFEFDSEINEIGRLWVEILADQPIKMYRTGSTPQIYTLANGYPECRWRNSADLDGELTDLLGYQDIKAITMVHAPEPTQEMVAIVEGIVHNAIPISGATMYAFGDSVTAHPDSWANTLAPVLGLSHVWNLSVSGAQWQTTNVTDNPQHGQPDNNIGSQIYKMQQLKASESHPDPDIIVLALGINGILPGDFTKDATFWEQMDRNKGLIPIGENNSWAAEEGREPSDYIDRTSLIGAARWAIQTLFEMFPNAVIMLSTPMQSNYQGTPGIENHPTRRVVATQDAIRAVGQRMGAMVIETGSEIGILDCIGPANDARWTDDGLHPDATGRVMMRNYMAEKIQKMYWSRF